MKRKILFHRFSAAIWALLLVPALIWWKDSVTFVILASIYANVKSDWGAAEAADERELVQRLARIEEELVMLRNSRGRKP